MSAFLPGFAMVRTRFAPSPTGYLHLGGARTALFNWAYTRRMGGEFILRIEDTDLERSTQQSEQAIFDALKWLGPRHCTGPSFHMHRPTRYKEIRGHDRVNNTPRQINLYKALDAGLPSFAHVPMILGADGQRLSKRHGAVNVMQYRDDGYLPDAMVNYLARLGWSHGDEEVFSRDQLVEWFDLRHVSKSPARWDPEKLKWMNAEYLKRLPDAELAARLEREKPEVYKVVASFMDPVAITAAGRNKFQLLGDHEKFLMAMAQPGHPDDALAKEHLGDAGREVLRGLIPNLKALDPWTAPGVSATLKAAIAERKVKAPQVMMPFRVAVTGLAQTPAIDAIGHHHLRRLHL